MKKKLFAITLAVVLMLSLTACGSKTDKPQYSLSAATEEAYSVAADMAYEGAGLFSISGSGNGASAPTADDTEGTSSESDLKPEKIIYSADVSVETMDFDKSVEDLNAFVAKYDAFVENSSINGVSGRRANYTLRIPAARFNDAMSEVSSIGSVISSSTYTDNVSAQYYDTQARVDSLKTQETRLLELMAKAETVEDIITIEARLSDLRYQIESLQSNINNWDRKVNYSTITLFVREVTVYTPVEKEGFFTRLGNNFIDSIQGAIELLGSIVMFVIAALPYLVVIIPIGYLLYRPFSKKAREKRKAKKIAPTVVTKYENKQEGNKE